MDKERTIYTLKEPITFADIHITELKFRAAKAEDVRRLPLEGQNIGHFIDIAGQMCGQPPAVMNMLGMADTLEVCRMVMSFTQPSPATGDTPSPS